ncbi:hypothetical protein H2O64_14750 [Kordia sp. YSTF-M3]|uniref:Uncharacterized protein n=1 Tax=Kordia aestuariivivens TaxID=2759037 RepID=A0ABR7QBJ0_9FLAO|nr:hypothetical protein [Kordia aestuariivivens]MBC8755935.1 hypothetical protein [Kordia aestuariivivens]
MIGDFLLEVTLIHTAIIAVISATILIFLAYKKPKFYESTSRILIIFIALLLFYRLGWEGSIEHHHVIRVNQSNIPNHFIGLFYVLLLMDVFWLRSVAQHRIEKSKSEEETVLR